MATPASSHASTTSGSRREPPGWMIARTPASMASLGPVGEREERVRGHHRAGELDVGGARPSPSRSARSPRGSSGPRRCRRWRGPSTGRSRSSARACTRASRRRSSPHSSSVGVRWVTARISSRDSRPRVAILHEQAAAHALHVVLGDRRAPPLLVLQQPHVGLGLEDLERLVGEAGRQHQPRRRSSSGARPAARSTGRLKQNTPP